MTARTSSRRTRPIALTALALTLAASTAGAVNATAAGAAAADTGALVMVPAMLGGLSHATRLADAPTGQLLTLGVAITGSDAQGETQLSHDLEDPASPNYHHYLTPAEFASNFGVPAAREQAIVGYLTAAGFTVAPASAAGTYLSATATVGQVEQLFHVTEGSYQVSGHDFLANEDPPQVPADLGIAGITGLDTLRQFYTADQSRAKLSTAEMAGLLAQAKAEAATASATTRAAAKPALNVPVVATKTLQPRDLWGIYDQPSTDMGQGQTAGIFGEGETDSVITQLRLFEAAESFPKVPVQVIRTEGDTTNEAAYGDNTGSIEWYLDVQALTGMAPDLAQLDLYFAKTLYDPDIFKSFSTWANDPNGPRQMNASFGECETNPTNPVTGPLAQLPYGTELGDDLEPVGEPILEQASMEGRTLFASAGDTGSGCPAYVIPVLGAGNGVAPSVPPLVNYPAASDYAVGVGGTVINFTGTGTTARRSAEASWEDTGGGASHFIAEPASQKPVTAVNQPCLTQPGGTPFAGPPPTCRGVPDVAALSGNTLGNGYFIYIDGAPSAEGGTSLSSPLTVGMWTRLQAASSAPGGLGFAATQLYKQYDYQTKGLTGSYGRDFFDVTQEESGATNGTAMPASGWDYTSGLGVFDVAHLLTDLDGSQNAVSASVPAEAPALASCTTTESSPVGNATDPAEVQLGNDPATDLSQTVFSADAAAKTLKVTITGPNFTGTDTDGTGTTFVAQWLFNGVVYFIEADGGGGTFTATDGNNNGAAAAKTPAATVALSTDGKTMTLTAPLSDLGSPPVGAQLLYPSVKAVLNVGTPAAIGVQTNLLSFTTDTASAGSPTQQSVGQSLLLGPCAVGAPAIAAAPVTTAAVKAVAKKTTHKKAVKAKKAVRKPAKKVTQPSMTLAYTGLNAALPLGAIVLVGAGLILARRRRASTELAP